MFLCKAKVIPVYDNSSDLLSVVLEETGGLGVDIVVDSGGTQRLRSSLSSSKL